MELEKIYELYFKDIYRFIFSISQNKEIAEDITQDTFIKVINNIEKFDNKINIKAYLFTIAKNTYYTQYRRQKKFTPIEDTQFSSSDNDLMEELIKEDESRNIIKIIHDMSEPFKEVFILRNFCDLSFKDIGFIFTKTESWARVIHYRARKLILKKFKEEKNE